MSRKLQILSNQTIWASRTEAISKLSEQATNIVDRQLISARYMDESTPKVIFGLGIISGEQKYIAILDGEAMPSDVQVVIDEIKKILDNKVDWSENKTSIIGPKNFSLTAMTSDSEGHVLICQRTYDEGNTFVTEIGSSNNKLTLNTADGNIQVDIKGGDKESVAYKSETKAAKDELQAKIDTIESNAGLSENGHYQPKADANYISGATSLKDADELLDTSLKSLSDTVTKHKVIAGHGISTSEAISGTTVAVKVAEADKVLSVDSNGLIASLRLNYNTDSKKVELIGQGDAVISEMPADAFLVDGMIQDVKLEGNNLIFTFNADGGVKPISVDLSKYIDVYSQGNGISIEGKTISAKLDPNTERFLTVGTNGIKLSGVQDAIDNAMPNTPDTIITKLNGVDATTTNVNLNFAFSTKGESGYTEETSQRMIPAATSEFAGVMTAADKAKFDAFFGTGETGGSLEDMLTEVKAGNGIIVANYDTVSVKVKDDDPFLEVTDKGVKTKDIIVIDCGEY